LRRVLVVSIGGVAVGAVLLTAAVTLGLARLGAEDRALAQLGGEVDRVVDLASELPCEGRLQPRLGREFGARVRFVPDDAPRPRLQRLTAPQGKTFIGGREAYYASRRTELCGRPGTLFVLQPVGEAAVVPEGFTERLVLAGLLGLAGAALVAYPISRRMSRPLGELARSARALARGESSGVAPPSATEPAEIADLREAFNGMVSDLRSTRSREKAFLLSVSHELRTPLTAIRGYGEALADGTAQRTRQAGEVVARESKRLERLVQDLLDLARLSSGEFSVRPENVDLVEIAGSVVEALSHAAKEYGVVLQLEAGSSCFAETDPDRVHQMIANLVENAVRVTPERGTVSVQVSDHSIVVADSGPGIEPEDIEHAFERFYLWSRYRGVRPVGSGLGLAIVGELAQRLGVRVTVTSAPGTGSRFALRFDA
jgi:two-component system sensor histidine kinase BaeS